MKNLTQNKKVQHICVGGTGHGGVILALTGDGRVRYTTKGKVVASSHGRWGYNGYNRRKDSQ